MSKLLRYSTNPQALRIALTYALFGALWILFSDRLLEAMVTDPARVNALQTWKGWFFIAVTAVLVFWMVKFFFRRISRAESRIIENEQRLRHLLDATGEAIYVIDEKGRCTFANAATARLLGVERPGDLLGMDMHALLHHSRPDGSPFPVEECPIHEVIRRGSSSRVDSELFWGADNQSFPVEYRCDALMKDDRPAGAVVVFTDISERLRMEKIIRQLQRTEAVGELTGGIAHHVNNMLTVILGNVRLAQRTLNKDSSVHARLESAIKAAQRGGVQVKRLLAFSRRQVLEPTQVDLARLVSQSEAVLSTAATDRIQLDIESNKNPWTVRVDPEQLNTALVNLVRNARDAIRGHGTTSIRLDNVRLNEAFTSAHPGAAVGEYVCLSVSDDGVGMAPGIADRAFEPFFTTKDVSECAGLGLSMVYGFIKQSGGYVEIDSEKGTGTTVRLYLPRWTGQALGTAQGKRSAAVTADLRKVILVVEDEPEVREVTAAQLRAMNFRVLEAADGQQALATLRMEPTVDLLFTDVVMPGGMNGMELVNIAREENPGLTVLYSSGYATDALAGVVNADGPIRVLNKPYTGEALSREVRHALETEAGKQSTRAS